MSIKNKIPNELDKDDISYQFSMKDIDHRKSMQMVTGVDYDTSFNQTCSHGVETQVPQNSIRQINNNKESLKKSQFNQSMQQPLNQQQISVIVDRSHYENDHLHQQSQSQNQQVGYNESQVNHQQNNQIRQQQHNDHHNINTLAIMYAQKQPFIDSLREHIDNLQRLSACRVFQIVLMLSSVVYKVLVFSYELGHLNSLSQSDFFLNIPLHDPSILKDNILIYGGIILSIFSILGLVLFNTYSINNLRNYEQIKKINMNGLKVASFIEVLSFSFMQAYLWSTSNLSKIIGILIFSPFLINSGYFISKYKKVNTDIQYCIDQLKINPFTQSVIV